MADLTLLNFSNRIGPEDQNLKIKSKINEITSFSFKILKTLEGEDLESNLFVSELMKESRKSSIRQKTNNNLIVLR